MKIIENEVEIIDIIMNLNKIVNTYGFHCTACTARLNAK